MNWHALQGLSQNLLSGLADASLSAVLLAGSAALVLLVLRRNSVAHHALWTCVLIGMLALPVLRPMVPAAYFHLPRLQGMNEVTVETNLVTFAEANNAPLLPSPQTGHTASRPGWTEYLAIIYLAGGGLLGLRLLLGLYLSRQWLRSSRSIALELWQHFDQVMAAGGEVQLEESDRTRVPLTTGILRTRLVLPLEWRTWSGEKLEAVLAHELAHARRRDPLISLIAAINKCIFWFHPLSWWLERRLALLAEHAADDSALAASRDPQSYARMVLEFASTLQQRRRLIWHDAAANRAAMAGPLVARRIRRIMNQQSGNYVRKLGRLGRIILFCGAAFLVWVSTTVDFQSVARAQEKQGQRDETFVMLTSTPRNQQGNEQIQPNAAYTDNMVGFWSDGEEADAASVTDEQAADMERQLALNPEDEEVRASLLRYYWQKRFEDKRAELILWLIDHHPDSNLHGRQTGAMFASGPHGNAKAFEDAKAAWRAQVNQHPENATILGNAGRFMNQTDLAEGIDLMKRSQAVDPEHRTQPLAWFYSLLLMNNARRSGVKESDSTLQVLNDLRASDDIRLVGEMARYLGRRTSPSTPAAGNKIKIWATEIIKHAEALEPQNREWPALLENVQRWRDRSGDPPVVAEYTPNLARISKDMAASMLIKSETPAYPPEALAIHLHGNAVLQVRIGKDGHVMEAKAVSGHPMLVRAAIEAVKNYVYKPFELNGNAVDVSTVVEVSFRE